MQLRNETMESLSDEQLEAFVTACRRMAECGLVLYSSGNMSWRAHESHMIVTAKGAWLGRMTRAEVALCRLDDGACVNDVNPSVESRFHAGIFRARPEVNVVLHFQSPCATTIACGEPQDYNYMIIPELPFYVGEPAVVECLAPGSPELAAAVIAAIKEHDMVILRNHGQVTVGKDFDDVLIKAGFFELACEILLHGKNIKPMPDDVIAALRARAAGRQGKRFGLEFCGRSGHNTVGSEDERA